MQITPPICKRQIISALSFLVKPITCQPAFFVLLYILLNSPDIFSLVLHSFVPLFKVSSGFLLCYLLSSLAVVLPSSLRKVYKSFLLILAAILFMADAFLLLVYGDTLGTISKDAVAAVMATNPAETVEFFATIFTVDRLFVITVMIFAISILFCYFRRMHFVWNNVCRCLLMLVLLATTAITLKSCTRLKESNFFYLLTYDCPDLRDYKHNPSVLCTGEHLDNIVLVIGESFAKFHSSLYEYDKETNPFLSRLRSDGAMLVYDNVTSAYGTTIPSVKSIMMSYLDSMSDSVDWFRCLTLIEVMQKAGYKTHWISNQSKTGLFDNEVGRFSDLCDEQFFVGNKHSGMNREYTDEELIPFVKGCLSDTSQPQFIVIQLMGSHFEFNKRYPPEFSRFNSADYVESHSHLSAYNRAVVAEYDNSVLYNDSVVYELMTCFEQENSIVFYFSDHGIDVFQSSDDYIGHAKTNDVISVSESKKIPFMVYTTRLFRDRHPELQKRIENAVNRPYRTDSIMYTVMDVAGVETVNGVSYRHKSLFK